MDLMLIGIIGLAVYYYSQGKAFVDTYQIKVKSVSFDLNESLKTGLKQLIAYLTVTINNPTKFIAQGKNLNLTVSYNGKLIGTFQNNDLITLKEGDQDYRLKVSLNTFELWPSVQDAFLAIKNKQSIELFIEGSALVNGVPVKINQTVKAF